MVPHRGLEHRQHLLPYEQQICDAIGISEEEYFDYFELVQQAKRARGQDYAHIPDVVNEPISLTTVLVNLAVGVALTAVSMLLAPKPKSPSEQKKRPNFDGSNIRGRTRYAPLTNFDAVQDLAVLGSSVPLIYTNRRPEQDDPEPGEDRARRIVGGVRVESQLLWSQLRNRHKHQELKTALLFSAGYIPTPPDLEGYALGDSILQDYTNSKVRLIFKPGGNAQGPAVANKSEDPANYDYFNDGFNYERFDAENGVYFKAYTPIRGKYEWLHCTTRVSSTSSTFGAYNPMPNGHGYKFQPEWPGKGDGEDSDTRLSIFAKRTKGYSGYMPYRCRVVKLDDKARNIEYVVNAPPQKQVYLANKVGSSTPDRSVREHFESGGNYYLNNQGAPDFVAGDGTNTQWVQRAGGIDTGTQASDQARSDASDSMDIGELYLLGAEIFRVKEISPTVRQPWDIEDRETRTHSLEREDEYNRSGYDYKGAFMDSPTRLRRPDRAVPLQRVTVGNIATTRAVDMVEIGIKSTVWRQVSGFPNVNELDLDRVNEYAKDGATYNLGTVDIYTDRLSFFRFLIRKVGTNTWDEPTGTTVFAVRGRNPQEINNMIRVGFKERAEYEFRFIPVSGNAVLNERYDYFLLYEGRSYRKVEEDDKYFIQAQCTQERLDTPQLESLIWYAELNKETKGDGVINNDKRQDNDNNPSMNPHNVISDWLLYDSESGSHENEPEHTINFINEYIEQPEEFTEDESLMYSRLCYGALALNSGKEWSDFSSFSGYFKEGIQGKRVSLAVGNTDDEIKASMAAGVSAPTNLLPDIVTDLLARKDFGVGEYVGIDQVDLTAMRTAGQFCNANDFTWDGVISDRNNIRDFIFENSAFALLNFTIIGGKFGLFPSVPYYTSENATDDDEKAAGHVNSAALPGDPTFEIRALFTDGNMRNYKVSFLSPEEREMFTAEVLYRKETENGFPETEAVTVRLTTEQGGFFRDPVESFDCTQFMTNQAHAIRFAKYALLTRKYVDHSVTFETTPDAAANLRPGAYIRVASEVTHYEPDSSNDWSKRFSVGCITPDGKVVSGQKDIDGKQIYYWKSSLPEVRSTTVQVNSDYTVSDTSLHGTLFSVIPDVEEPRVYQVEALTINEDAMVEITATVVPLTSEGRQRVTQWSAQQFVIQGSDK